MSGLFDPPHVRRTEALLRWVRLRLIRLARSQGLTRQQGAAWRAGLGGGEAEAVALLAAHEASPPADPGLAELDALLVEVGAQAWPASPDGHPLEELARRCDLDRVELLPVLLGLSLELDDGVGGAVACLQEEPPPARPRLGLALRLAAEDGARERLRAALAPRGALRRLELLLLSPVEQGLEASLAYRRFKLADRVLDWLRGEAEPDPRLLPALGEPVDLTRPLQGLTGLPALLRTALERPGPALLLLQGPEGIGKRHATAHAAALLGRPLLPHDLAQALPVLPAWGPRLQLVLRECRLQGAILLLDHLDALDREGEELLLALLATHPLPVVATGRVPPRAHPLPPWLQAVSVAGPDQQERVLLWRQALHEVPLAPETDLEELAARFAVGAGVIHQAAAIVRRPGPAADRAQSPVGMELLSRTLWRLLQHDLGDLAERIATPLTWDDLVVPDELADRLLELVRTIRYRELVLGEWGFARKLGGRRGVSALFAGPPGTGKTLCARIIARELGRELFRIDLSRVVSKYIGETEKNLGRVFDEAARSQSIILFDEADALFGTRTDVKSAVDRYANMEVNYLLQRIEEYEGISLLTTNFPRSIDEAFKRRLSFRITFPFPDVQARTQLWQVLLPPELPVAADLDLAWLAERYEMAGGNIRNAVLRAAFLVAEERRPVEMEDLARAADLEYEEMGKLVSG